jgi:hypothetical protein
MNKLRCTGSENEVKCRSICGGRMKWVVRSRVSHRMNRQKKEVKCFVISLKSRDVPAEASGSHPRSGLQTATKKELCVKEQDGERGSDSTFIVRKLNFKTRNILRDCPIILLVKVG